MKVAIVTGGGRGIGRAIACELAAAGWAVAVVARSRPEIAETADAIHRDGGRAIAIAADVSDAAAVRRMVAEAEEQLGVVDLLVNNAGVGGPFGPIQAVDADQWWRCLEVNLRGPLLCVQSVLPGMIERGRGRIVNVASGAGTLALPNMSAYVASKTALIRFTENLDAEVADKGIRAFSVSPGTVRTAMAEKVLDDPEAARQLPFLANTFEEGRDVSPDLCAKLVHRIAAGECDGLSGCFLHVEDDLDALIPRAEEIRRKQQYRLRLNKLS
jgi:NAD(P)-dependent dehydrogenase (short-subunit alcohol dehydrogenase family)